MRDLIALHLVQNWLFLVFLIVAILVDVNEIVSHCDFYFYFPHD